MVRAPPRVLPRSLAPSRVPWGGAARSRFPPTWLGVVGVVEGRPKGGAFHCCKGRLRSGAPHPPTARPLGGLSGSATHVLWARACGHGGPTLSPWPARSVGAACRWGRGGPSPYLAWGCAPPVGRVRGVGVPRGGLGGGAAPAPRPPFVQPGGPVGRGVALPRSVPLPYLGRQQSGCHWRRSGHGGRGPHTTPVRARPPSLGAICAPSWRVGAGPLVPRGSCGTQQLGRGGGPCSGSSLGRGEGGPSPLPRGVGAGAPAACGLVGGVGGGVAPRPPCSPSGGRPAVPYPGPFFVVGALPPGVRVRSGSQGPPRGRGDKGLPVDRSSGDPFRIEPPLCPRVGNGHGGGHGGHSLHTVLVRRRAPSPGLVRAPLPRAGVGSPVGRDPGASRGLGAPGRAVCRYSHIPPPRVAVPSGGGGASPRHRGGGGSLLWPSSWGGGSGGGGGWGCRPTAPGPPAPSGVSLLSVVSGVPLQGILVPWGLPGGRGRRARPGRPPMGQCGGGGGDGGGEPPHPGSRPRLPRAGLRRGCSVCAVLGAASPPSVSSRQGGSVRAVHHGRLPRPQCSLTPGAAASSGGVRGRRLFGLPLSASGPE